MLGSSKLLQATAPGLTSTPLTPTGYKVANATLSYSHLQAKPSQGTPCGVDHLHTDSRLLMKHMLHLELLKGQS